MTEPLTVREAWAMWDRVKRAKPLVQCLTNDVAMDITANVLLAAGASPAMVSSSDECEAFARTCASGVLINLGTLTSAAVAAQRLAMVAAREAKVPVVLDPVACGATPYRTQACVEALKLRPMVVRGNAGEVCALAQAAGVLEEGGGGGGGGDGGDGDGPMVRGVDSAVDAADARVELAAEAIADRFGCVVAVSGEVDIVVSPLPPVDGLSPSGPRRIRRPTIRVRNGVEMLTRVTAAGCSLTALIAAFAAVHHTRKAGGPDATPLSAEEVTPAVAAALCAFGVAAEMALERAERKGPGSLRVGLIDELALMTCEDFAARAKIDDS